MNRNERYDNLEAALLAALQGLQSRMWTAMPVIIDSVSLGPNGQVTCNCYPAITQTVVNPDQTTSKVQMPMLLDAPLHFPQGGGLALTFPVSKGDEGMAVFASRCIDGWWQNGGVQNEAELRMHDLSDAMVFVGFNSQPKIIPGISLTSATLRTFDGTTYVEVTQDKRVNIQAPGGFTCYSPNFVVNLSGEVDTTGEGVFNGHTVGAHTHTQPNDGHGDHESPTDPPTG